MKNQIEFMTKANEVHLLPKYEVFPRLLGNPHKTMKAVGAYFGRACVAIMKKYSKGFMCGYNENEICEIMV